MKALGALRIVDPARWEAKVREALASTNGNVTAAASLLEIERKTLQRWLRDPRLADAKLKRSSGEESDHELPRDPRKDPE